MFTDVMLELLETRVSLTPSTEVLFSQYRDVNAEYDLSNAADVRRQTLANYIGCFSDAPPTLLVGEAAGPWGCRFSGVPFTVEG